MIPRKQEVLDLLESNKHTRDKAETILDWLSESYSAGYMACPCESQYDY